MKFQIVSDSSCDLGRERAQQLGVALVSFYVAFEGEPYYREERDITSRDFYRMMAQRPGDFPKTSMPTVEDYLEAFEPAVRAGMPVLCICLNEAFSGSIQGARNARELLLEEYPKANIHVMDSKLATVLQGLLVEQAAVLRDRGCTLEEAVAALEPLREKGRIFFTTNDLDYLRHGGRIGKAAAATGALLKVKPLIGYYNCGLISDGIAQGRKKSLTRVLDLFYRYLERNQIDLTEHYLVTGYGLDQEEHQDFARRLLDGLRERGLPAETLGGLQIGVTIGVHTGPTPIGVGILKREPGAVEN